LNEYKNVGQLIEAIKDYEGKARRDVKKVEGGNVVYEDPRFFVVNPLNHQSSCYYGKGTKWCTAADSDYQFSQYNQDGKIIYILDKTKPTNDPYYKIALLQKFDGNRTFYDSKDESIQNISEILGKEEFEKISNSINEYLESEFADQLKIWRDKEAAKKERERIERLKFQRILHQREEEAQERRLEGEWTLDENCPEEGLKAHALLDWLVDNNDVDVWTKEERDEVIRLQNEIERLQSEYDNSEDVQTELLDEISDLEDEIEQLSENKIDVYNIIPTGSFYDTTEFEVINAGLDDRRYAVGTEDEMQSSCESSVENLIDDIGYEGFNSSFARSHIDVDAVVSYAEDVYEDDVRDNAEVYLDENERQISDQQREKIEILKMRISQTEELISNLEEHLDGPNSEEIEEKIDEYQDMISEYESDIEDIENSPEGEFPDEMIEEKVQELVDDVRSDPEYFMNDYGLNWADYVDKDAFIQDVIDTDGFGHTLNSYDGNADEVTVQDELFYVMRID
jgi:DNA repair exonuclease SbcCD ATPase subunit